MRHANRPVTKTMILEHIFDYSFDPQTNVVDVLVHRLRSKVDKDKAMIHTSAELAMFSGLLEPLRRSIGLRLSLWYALIFTVSSAALLALAYYLLAAARRQQRPRSAGSAAQGSGGGLSRQAASIALRRLGPQPARRRSRTPCSSAW